MQRFFFATIIVAVVIFSACKKNNPEIVTENPDSNKTFLLVKVVDSSSTSAGVMADTSYFTYQDGRAGILEMLRQKISLKYNADGKLSGYTIVYNTTADKDSAVHALSYSNNTVIDFFRHYHLGKAQIENTLTYLLENNRIVKQINFSDTIRFVYDNVGNIAAYSLYKWSTQGVSFLQTYTYTDYINPYSTVLNTMNWILVQPNSPEFASPNAYNIYSTAAGGNTGSINYSFQVQDKYPVIRSYNMGIPPTERKNKYIYEVH